MIREANLKSKKLYKLLLIVIKYTPFLMSSCFALNTILALAGIDFPILSMVSGMSVFTWVFMYLAALVFRFCMYHRMFLWYILSDNIVSAIDFYIDLPINDFQIIAIHSIVICIFLFVILYLYIRRRRSKYDTNNKEIVIGYYR